MKLTKSNKLYKDALRLIPWGTQTNAKKWHEHLREFSPAFIERGKGCHIWDIDGNEYIDFKCALGPIILGYADNDVNTAVKKQIDSGTMYNMAHPLEIELARMINELVPCAERVRFLKTGNDANCAAVRIARAVTGKDKVISIGFHGWTDTLNAKNIKLGGIPTTAHELMFDVKPNDLDTLKDIIVKHKNEVAILIMDIACHRDVDIEYLKAIRNLTNENKILLAFDEVITGFRYSLGGAQEYYGVTPDLACFAKGISNGYSISALCGKAKFMDEGFEKTVITGTYYGATTDIAASIATIKKLKREKVNEKLWARGKKLKDFINETAGKTSSDIKASGPSCIFDISSKSGETGKLCRKLLEKSLFPGSSYWFIQYSHTEEELNKAFEIIERAFLDLKNER